MSHHLQMHIDSIRCDDHNIKAVMGLCISLHWSRLGGQKLTILSNVEARRPGEVVLTRMWSSLSAVLPSLLLHLHSFHPSALLSRFKLHPHHLHWLLKAYIQFVRPTFKLCHLRPTFLQLAFCTPPGPGV